MLPDQPPMVTAKGTPRLLSMPPGAARRDDQAQGGIRRRCRTGLGGGCLLSWTAKRVVKNSRIRSVRISEMNHREHLEESDFREDPRRLDEIQEKDAIRTHLGHR